MQTLLGIEERVHAFELRAPGVAANQVLVRFELQADCLAGVWASMVQERLELGDLEEAFAATKALGDDTIDQKTTAWSSRIPSRMVRQSSGQIGSSADWLQDKYRHATHLIRPTSWAPLTLLLQRK